MFINEQIGERHKYGSKPAARYMSVAFFEEWSRRPTQSNLRLVGIYEHKTPMKSLEISLHQAKSSTEALRIIKNDAFCAWITHSEDNALTQSNLRSSLSEVGDRYDLVGIKIHPCGPVYFNARASRSNNRECGSK
jgi:hypothetical protein